MLCYILFLSGCIYIAIYGADAHAFTIKQSHTTVSTPLT